MLAQTDNACHFSVSFTRPDEGGSRSVRVYEGRSEPALHGMKPLLFVVPDVKVNTDGTRISYKVDDPRARNGAINNIRNAMRARHSIAEFERLAQSDWQPLSRTWQVLSGAVIEKDRRTGKPCVTADNFLVSMTADVAVAGAQDRIGDCDHSKWIDALSIPALVLPGGSKFQAKGAKTRSLVVAMTLTGPERIAFGIVGDTGPANELGEASVEMNRILRGLPDGDKPNSYRDAVRRFQGPKSVILIFPGTENRLAYPVTAERVLSEVEARFDAWGGKPRLAACLHEIPESGR
ncbi:MAG: hypothetical protein L0Y50_10250 [Beijerinckiaceae bacterium]|nr:hypothetical protein [Beijerinckiaceae bacterium]